MIDSEQLKQNVVKAVEEIRATNPMAGSITNTVTIDFVANAQLAVGGSAAMVYLPDEGEALVAGGGAIYLNMGTLFPIYEQTIPRAAKAAHDAGKPWVLDPVGLGIGSLRTQLVNELKQYKPAIVRGNASEIIALAGLWGLEGEAADLSRVRGVDTTDTVDAARDAAVALARYTGGAVVVSGEVDLITDGTTVAKSHGGSPLMSKITGCGCSQGGVLAVYACVTDPFTAAICGTAVYNVAGSRAAAVADAPASFKVAFIDELYRATAQDIADNQLELEEASAKSEPATAARMNTLVAVAIAPCGTGDELSAEVAEVVRVIRESGLPNRTTSMFTEIEGDWDEVMQVVRDATFVLASKGIRIEVVLKADIRPGFTDTMTGKLERMEAQIKKQEETR